MDYLTAKKFSFVSSALPADTFGVVRYHGSEGLSRCYEFEVMLVSDNLDVDLADVIQHPVTLTFHREGGTDVQYQGILLGFEQLHSYNRVAFYRAHLVPRLYWLSLTPHNQVFLNKSIPECIEACLKDGGLSELDFEFRLQKSYVPVAYVCQYGETHLNFVTRWLERTGMYYFFEQSEEREKVIFTDSQIVHKSMPQGKSIRYSPPSGMETLHMQEMVSSFTCRYSLTPASVLVRDYNYMKPSMEVRGTAEVDEKGRGQLYFYGDHVRTTEEGNLVAKVYAESLLCRREVFHGEGSVPYVSPGFTFDLVDHYRKSFNQSYLTLDVDHEGSQTGYLLAGLWSGAGDGEIYYRNSYTAIPASVQFRPERVTPRPQISGSISAKVDAAGSGQYAELDDHGRYKVVLPFDISGMKDGKASAWFRMATPYAGSDHGMHFPLHKDTEVFLSFIEGDPDRPFIAGAVPNLENQSPVKDSNMTMAAITTGGGNKIHMEDKEGSESILMHVSKQNSFIRIGAPSDSEEHGEHKEKEEGHDEEEKWKAEGPGTDTSETGTQTEDSYGIHLFTHKLLDIKAETKNEIILGSTFEMIGGATTDIVGGAATDIVGGFRTDITIGLETNAVLGGKHELHWPEKLSFKNFHFDTEMEKLEAKVEHIEATAASHTKLITSVQEVNADVLKAQGVLTSVVSAKSDAIASLSKVVGSELKTQANEIKACITKTEALTTGLETVGTRLHTIGTEVSTLGSKIETLGTKVSTTGTSSETHGVYINTSGLISLS